MQFDQFDKKFRDAAQHHHPAYDEKAWSKMEKLLDKHMPGKNNRRFIVFWMLGIGLLLTGLFVYQPWKNSNATKNLSEHGLTEKLTLVSPDQHSPANSSTNITPDQVSIEQPV